MFEELSCDPAEKRREVATYIYNRENKVTAVIDPVAGTQFVCYDLLGRPFQSCYGQEVHGADGAAAAPGSPACGADWIFCLPATGKESAFDIYVSSPVRLSGRDWHRAYAVCGAALAPDTELADTPAGLGWYKLGSVTVPASTSQFRLCYRGGATPRAVVAVETESNRRMRDEG